MTLFEARQKYEDRVGATIIVSYDEYEELRELVSRLRIQYGRWNGQLFGRKFVVKYGA